MNEMVKTVGVLTATKNLTWIFSLFQHTRGICRITLTVLKLPLKQHHLPILKLFLCDVRGVTHIGTNMLSSLLFCSQKVHLVFSEWDAGRCNNWGRMKNDGSAWWPVSKAYGDWNLFKFAERQTSLNHILSWELCPTSCWPHLKHSSLGRDKK